MKKKFILTFVFIFLFSAFSASADTAMHLTISDNSGSIYDNDLTVTPCDSDNDPVTPDIASAYCAILQSGVPNVWDWSWPPGAFLTSLNNISGFTTQDANGADVYHYWSWSSNGSEGMTGLNQYELQAGDLIALTFIDPLPPPPPEPTPSSSGGGGGGGSFTRAPIAVKPVFDLKKAINFLVNAQNENGSYGELLYTDWTTLGIASYPEQQETLAKLAKYFSTYHEEMSLTDSERHSIALLSAGMNPYQTNGVNYIGKIVSSFDGKQFGSKEEDNDDIFALIVLKNAGYTYSDPIVASGISFILSAQAKDGSWDGSVDMTGAAIQSLYSFKDNMEVSAALSRAKDFLKQSQDLDGGWKNVSSTAWAMEGIKALGEKPADWLKNGNSPLNYLAQYQGDDGAMKADILQNKIWQTAYVISALSEKTWNEIMTKVEKPVPLPEIKPVKIFKQKIEPKNDTTIALPEVPVIEQKQPMRRSWWRVLLQKLVWF